MNKLKNKAEMETIETQQNEGDDESANTFASVMGPEHPGRLRLYGRGVTKSSLKGKVGFFEPSLNGASDLELEEKIERMLEDKLEERDTRIRQKTITDFLACLQSAGVEFDYNQILTNLGLPGEASSTQRATVQVHRPSTGSHNNKELVSASNNMEQYVETSKGLNHKVIK